MSLLIEELAAELDRAERKLADDPNNPVLIRIRNNRLADRGTMKVRVGKRKQRVVNMLVTVEQWRSIEAGTHSIVAVGSRFTILSKENIERQRKFNLELAQEISKAYRRNF